MEATEQKGGPADGQGVQFAMGTEEQIRLYALRSAVQESLARARASAEALMPAYHRGVMGYDWDRWPQGEKNQVGRLKSAWSYITQAIDYLQAVSIDLEPKEQRQ